MEFLAFGPEKRLSQELSLATMAVEFREFGMCSVP